MIDERSYRIDQIDWFGYRKYDGGAEHKQVVLFLISVNSNSKSMCQLYNTIL